jgi:hypothetical protein
MGSKRELEQATKNITDVINRDISFIIGW